MHAPSSDELLTTLFVITALGLLTAEFILPAIGVVIGCILAKKRSKKWLILAVPCAGIFVFFSVRALLNVCALGANMDPLTILSGPLIGGAIGYFTNYIAIRMLFRPAKAVYIGKFRLPFTPGIVPRRKDELAGILGKAVVARFFNSDDLAEVFRAPAFRDAVAASVTEAVFDAKGALDLKTLMPAEAASMRESVVTQLSYRIREALIQADLPQLAAVKGGQFIRNSLGDVSAIRFLTDDMIAKLAAPVGIQLERYIATDGRPIIRSLVEKEIDGLMAQPAAKLLADLKLERTSVQAALGRLYDGFIGEHVQNIVAPVDIAAQIEGKVKEMSPLELEGLVLSVVKRELRGVVLLGALLGFLIGIVNIFI